MNKTLWTKTFKNCPNHKQTNYPNHITRVEVHPLVIPSCIKPLTIKPSAKCFIKPILSKISLSAKTLSNHKKFVFNLKKSVMLPIHNWIKLNWTNYTTSGNNLNAESTKATNSTICATVMAFFITRMAASMLASGPKIRWKVVGHFTMPMNRSLIKVSGIMTSYMGSECCIMSCQHTFRSPLTLEPCILLIISGLSIKVISLKIKRPDKVRCTCRMENPIVEVLAKIYPMVMAYISVWMEKYLKVTGSWGWCSDLTFKKRKWNILRLFSFKWVHIWFKIICLSISFPPHQQ